MIKFELIREENRRDAIKFFEDNWCSSIIVSKGKIHDVQNLRGFVAIIDGVVKGMITYCISNGECEIVSLDSIQERCGIGSTLINKVIEAAKRTNCYRVWLITSNDNIDAIKFYQKRSFDMVCIHKNAILESRKIKPQIPLYGYYGIPIIHEIEFEKLLD